MSYWCTMMTHWAVFRLYVISPLSCDSFPSCDITIDLQHDRCSSHLPIITGDMLKAAWSNPGRSRHKRNSHSVAHVGLLHKTGRIKNNEQRATSKSWPLAPWLRRTRHWDEQDKRLMKDESPWFSMLAELGYFIVAKHANILNRSFARCQDLV